MAADNNWPRAIVQQSVAYAATIASIDLNNGDKVILGSLTGDCIVTAFANPSSNRIVVIANQDATGGRNLTITGINLGTGLANQKIAIEFQYDGTDYLVMNSPTWM